MAMTGSSTLCRAHARSTGKPCRAKALANGRCRMHGGLSSGPRTPEGLAAIGAAAKKRYYDGGSDALNKGYERWLEDGGRAELSRSAKRRWMRLTRPRKLAF